MDLCRLSVFFGQNYSLPRSPLRRIAIVDTAAFNLRQGLSPTS